MDAANERNSSLVYGASFHDRMMSALRETPWWAISFFIHGLLLVFAYFYTWEIELPKNEVEIQSKIEDKIEMPQVMLELPKPVDQQVKPTDKRVTTERKVSLSQKNLPQINNILKPGNPSPEAPILAAPGGVIRVGRLGDGEGLVVGSGLGDALSDMAEGGWSGWKNRCLAVWLFDESKSMKDDQQLIRTKVDELYENLGISAAGASSDKRIMTVVCSYGKDFHVELAEPTADMKKIREAIDKIPTDDSGKENSLAAINGVLNEFSGYANKYSRSVVIVLVTDEAGDDDKIPTVKDPASPLEVTVARMKTVVKKGASLLVFGYEAGAFRYPSEQTYDPTVAKGVSPWSWVNRGNDTAYDEMLPYDTYFRSTGRVPSGFGPYSMSRLCRETGGVYYLLRAVGAKTYDYAKLLKGYQPEIESRAEIATRNGKNNARRTLMQIVEGWDTIGSREENTFSHYFSNNDAGKKQMEHSLKVVDEWIAMINEGIKRMAALANVSFNDGPNPQHWEATRDLMWAQLHKQRFQLVQYRLTLLDLQAGRDIPPPGDIGWHISWYRNTVIRGDQGQVADERKKIQAMFQEVVDKHAGTPWEVYARSEMRSMRGFAIMPYSRSGPSNIKTEAR